ncbi:hypothetical protein NliqN6_2516 [Naganishia liquefaciens]|uniref:Uncharacterized protein n=1 Tax=Naganishia liquefaciens TaxID=104408 RepID=A0A8H3TSC0_9TREE|nr:hypothetical protein NliqN6_2516 [Naganishia liquefaciens]
MNMTSTPDDDYTDGFAGPAVGKVDFSPIGEEGMYAEMRDLQSRIVNYIDQRGSAAPASDKDTAALIVKNLVKFHHESDIWIDHVGKAFVKAQLIDRLCDFFSYWVELSKRLDDKKECMLYTEAQQMSLDIFFIGTVLAGLHKTESAQLYLALNQMLAFKLEQRKLRLGDGPVRMQVVIDSDQHLALNGYNPSIFRIKTKVPRVTKKFKEQVLAGK